MFIMSTLACQHVTQHNNISFSRGKSISRQEEQVVKKIRKAKLFVFLRQHRHELFDEAFQEELAGLYRKAERGHPPVDPAILALALILEAYTGVSDWEQLESGAGSRLGSTGAKR